MPVPLSYAPPQRWHQRPRIRRVIGWTAAVFVAAYLCVVLRNVPRRITLMHEQQFLEGFLWPPGHVVYAYAAVPKPDAGQPTPGQTIPTWRDFTGSSTLDATVFIHRLQTPGRAPRIVGVKCVAIGNPPDVCFEAEVYARGNVFHWPVFLSADYFDDALELHAGDRLTLFGGQLDPSDSRHFIIQFEFDSKPGIIDGWLEPDDHVKLERRQ